MPYTPVDAKNFKLRDGKPFLIYALVCPMTLDPKYVGQTMDIEQRVRLHRSAGRTSDGTAFTQWLKSLGYLRPNCVILERGINRLVKVKPNQRLYTRGRNAATTLWLSSCLETKWIKRFRKTILNTNKEGNRNAYAVLTNGPLPWDEGS